MAKYHAGKQQELESEDADAAEQDIEDNDLVDILPLVDKVPCGRGNDMADAEPPGIRRVQIGVARRQKAHRAIDIGQRHGDEAKPALKQIAQARHDARQQEVGSNLTASNVARVFQYYSLNRRHAKARKLG